MQVNKINTSEILKNLQNGSAALRSHCLDVICIDANPDTEFGQTSAADILLGFCEDGDTRVRSSALNALCIWSQYDKRGRGSCNNKLKFEWISENWTRVYNLACRLITEDNSKVRQVCIRTIYQLGLRFAKQEAPIDDIGLIENASLDQQVTSIGIEKHHHYHSKNNRHDQSQLLADDAFSRISDRLQDPSRHVRQLAALLVGDLAEFVAEESLMLTLEKTVMSDRQVKRSATDRTVQNKTSLWGPAISAGRRGPDPTKSLSGPTPVSQNGPLIIDSISLLSTGALGAVINGLEDEFHEVRCATLKTVTRIASFNARFASVCQDILVDMLTDDIQAVRLLAVNALQAVGDQVPILNDQVAIVTSALAEDSVVMRQRIHHLLSRCCLVSPPCLMSLLDGLLANLRLYAEDRDSIWRCASSIGARHPAFVEVCVSSLLRTHPWLSDQEPFREDPAYITVLLLVLNAQPGAPGMSAHFPRHLAASQAYLRELVPSMLPKETINFSFEWKPSVDICLPPKRGRFEIETTDCLEISTNLFRFLASCILLVQRLLTQCVTFMLETCSEFRKPNLRTTEETMDISEPTTRRSGRTESKAAKGLRDCLVHLTRVISQELRISCRQGWGALGDLPGWLDCLATAAWCLLSAHTSAIHLVTRTRLLKRTLKLIQKAEHLYRGLSVSEIDALQRFQATVSLCLTNACRPSLNDCCSAIQHLSTTLLSDLVVSNDNDDDDLATVARLHEAANRIHRVLVRLLRHPGASITTDGGEWTEEEVGEETEESASSVSIPEVRFTAILSTVAVRIRAVVTGFTFTEARERIRVTYRRPDPICLAVIDLQTTRQRCPLLSWHPPVLSWKSCSNQMEFVEEMKKTKIHDRLRLELDTWLELTAPCWTEAATLEVGLSLLVRDKQKADKDSLISLLPSGGGMRVKLSPCDPSQRF